MANTFEILTAFLKRYGEEVKGRGADDLPPEIADQLRSFARGGLSAPDQTRLIERLNEHAGWVAALAAEVKSLRTPPEMKRPK